MKVKELVEELKKFPEDWEVLMSIDPEGNGFDTLYNIDICNTGMEEGQGIDPIFHDEKGNKIAFEDANAIMLWP